MVDSSPGEFTLSTPALLAFLLYWSCSRRTKRDKECGKSVLTKFVEVMISERPSQDEVNVIQNNASVAYFDIQDESLEINAHIESNARPFSACPTRSLTFHGNSKASTHKTPILSPHNAAAWTLHA